LWSPKGTTSLLRFPTIQRIEREYNASCMAPEGCFIATEPVESEIGQIDQAQKAAGELDY
jgi:hypothetical protein